MNMQITSTQFKSGERIPSKHTCDGECVSPPLVFEGVPQNAVSLVLIVEDPDVPKSVREDGMWDHWLVWNMSPEIQGIPEGEVPVGIIGINTSGRYDWTPPCPPDREHRYFFRLYALDVVLDLERDASKAELLRALEGHILEQAELMGRYKRMS